MDGWIKLVYHSQDGNVALLSLRVANSNTAVILHCWKWKNFHRNNLMASWLIRNWKEFFIVDSYFMSFQAKTSKLYEQICFSALPDVTENCHRPMIKTRPAVKIFGFLMLSAMSGSNVPPCAVYIAYCIQLCVAILTNHITSKSAWNFKVFKAKFISFNRSLVIKVQTCLEKLWGFTAEPLLSANSKAGSSISDIKSRVQSKHFNHLT